MGVGHQVSMVEFCVVMRYNRKYYEEVYDFCVVRFCL